MLCSYPIAFSSKPKQIWMFINDVALCKIFCPLWDSHSCSTFTMTQVPDILYLSPFHLSILFWKLSKFKSNQFLKSISYLLLHNKQHFWCGQKEQEQKNPFIFFHKSHILIFFHVPFFPSAVPGAQCFLHKQISDLRSHC